MFHVFGLWSINCDFDETLSFSMITLHFPMKTLYTSSYHSSYFLARQLKLNTEKRIKFAALFAISRRCHRHNILILTTTLNKMPWPIDMSNTDNRPTLPKNIIRIQIIASAQATTKKHNKINKTDKSAWMVWSRLKHMWGSMCSKTNTMCIRSCCCCCYGCYYFAMSRARFGAAITAKNTIWNSCCRNKFVNWQFLRSPSIWHFSHLFLIVSADRV